MNPICFRGLFAPELTSKGAFCYPYPGDFKVKINEDFNDLIIKIRMNPIRFRGLFAPEMSMKGAFCYPDPGDFKVKINEDQIIEIRTVVISFRGLFVPEKLFCNYEYFSCT